MIRNLAGSCLNGNQNNKKIDKANIKKENRLNGSYRRGFILWPLIINCELIEN